MRATNKPAPPTPKPLCRVRTSTVPSYPYYIYGGPHYRWRTRHRCATSRYFRRTMRTQVRAGGTGMYPQNCKAILKTLLALPAVSFAKRPRMAVLHKKERSGRYGFACAPPAAHLSVLCYPRRTHIGTVYYTALLSLNDTHHTYTHLLRCAVQQHIVHPCSTTMHAKIDQHPQ